jgi:hypothetical protein
MDAFLTPPAVAATPLVLQVEDPSGMYLKRAFTLNLPLQTADEDAPDYLFKPVSVGLFPTPAAPVLLNWAVVRAVVHRQDDANAPLGGALVRLSRNGDAIGLGVTDKRGEALVATGVLPLISASSGGGPLLTSEYEAVLDARVNLAADPPDPDVLAATSGLPSASTTITIAPKRQVSVSIAIPVP